MRVAAIYDIHANLPALEAVINDARKEQVELILFGGDIVPGPMPRETFDFIKRLEIPAQFIRGNCDHEVIERMSGRNTEWYKHAPSQATEPIRWAAEQLDDEHKRMMLKWPLTLKLDIDGLGEVLFCHATPEDDNDCFTRLTDNKRRAPGARARGQSHRQLKPSVFSKFSLYR